MVYEKTNDDTYTYHYDHLGSTKLVTDRNGKSVCKFGYGTYGELLTTEYLSVNENSDYVPRISFLYNGQYGVITDDNGLYYMRSRYYNPEIKRFINQDILTGSIGNSASLNRYSYVEGNPVSYTDPFGLSPFRHIHTFFHALYVIPGVGRVFAAADAALYLAEGEYVKAGMSAVFMIPGSEAVAFGLGFTTGVGAFFTPDDIRENCDIPIVKDLFEYYDYDLMSKGEIAFGIALSGLLWYGTKNGTFSEPTNYEGDYIDFPRQELQDSLTSKKGHNDVGFINPGETSYGKSSSISGADNIADAARLKEYYKQAEKYGTGSIKELENGRFRFYEEIKPARTNGEMAGARHVREWDPYTGLKRDWYETIDHNGNIRQVRPDPNITGGVKVHYMFDSEGKYIGKWSPE